jgi:hypothetical protein
MKKMVLFAALILSSSLVMAAGGKVRDQSPIFNEDGEYVGSIVPVPQNCTAVVSQSGKAVYMLCDEEDE